MVLGKLPRKNYFVESLRFIFLDSVVEEHAKFLLSLCVTHPEEYQTVLILERGFGLTNKKYFE